MPTKLPTRTDVVVDDETSVLFQAPQGPRVRVRWTDVCDLTLSPFVNPGTYLAVTPFKAE